MQILLTKEKNRCNTYLVFEKKKRILKTILNNTNLPIKLRYKIYKKLIKLPKDSSITKITRRCVISNRSRPVYKKIRLSRITFRELALDGALVGIKKAS